MAGHSIKHFPLINCLYGALLLALCIYIVFFTDFKNLIDGYPDEHYTEFSEGWKEKSGIPVNLSKVSKVYSGDILRIYHTLPDSIQPGEALNIYSHNLFFSVYIDGSKVYDYPAEENLIGYGPGDVYHTVALTPQNAGTKVMLEIDLDHAIENGGSIKDILICDSVTFNHLIFREKGVGALLSLVIIFLGIMILIFRFAFLRDKSYGYDLVSLCISVLLIGIWTLAKSGVPQLLVGMNTAFRVVDYMLLLFMIYPMIRFVNSILKKQNPIYQRLMFFAMMITLTIALVARFGSGTDMHRIMAAFMISYVFAIGILGFMLIKNHIYCRTQGIPDRMKGIYFGAAALLVGSLMDVLIYVVPSNTKENSGNFIRLGLIIFIISMIIQIIFWLLSERRTSRRDSFVNSMMQYAMSGESADTTMCQILEYLGKELHPKHVYIYEHQEDGTYINTFYWSEEEGIRKKGNLTPITDPDIVERLVLPAFRESGSVVVKNREQYKETLPKLYDLLTMLNVTGMILVPIHIGKQYFGFLGMMDPPTDDMDEIADIMKVLEFFVSQTIRRRGIEHNLITYSYYDQVTGVKNRRALEEFEQTELDPSKAYGYIMCDINGLKVINDTKGHEAGDRLIKDVADSLSIVYSKSNVYRMGGDEFAAYVTGTDEEGFTASIEQLKEEISKRGRSASLGFVFRPDGDPDYERVKKEADHMMYEDKKRYYSGRHDRRTR